MRIPLLLALCLAATSPAWAQTRDVAATPVSPQNALARDAFVWRFAPEVGSRWELRTFSRFYTLQNSPPTNGIPARQTEMIVIQHQTVDYDVLSRDRFGATTIRMAFRKLHSNVKVFNNKRAQHTDNNMMNRVANQLIGASLTIKQAPDGTVWGVDGLEKLLRRVYAANGVSDYAAQTRMIKAEGKKASEGILQSLNITANKMPLYPLRVGESWTSNLKRFAYLPTSIELPVTHTLKSLTPEIALIADNARYDGATIGRALADTANNEFAPDVSGLTATSSGFTRVQRATGMPLEATLNQSFQGKIIYRENVKGRRKSWSLPQTWSLSNRTVFTPR